jgi:hypothetical protein
MPAHHSSFKPYLIVPLFHLSLNVNHPKLTYNHNGEQSKRRRIENGGSKPDLALRISSSSKALKTCLLGYLVSPFQKNITALYHLS